ncbi:uncharacterized protein LOC144114598 [Amblyomma americanum]
MAVCVRRSKRERGQPLTSGQNVVIETDEPPSDDETVVYCVDCSSGTGFSPWSEHTAPTATSSWDEDFNASATAQVQQTLDAIDCYLYEDETGGAACNHELRLECDRWKQQFLHLRVIGKRITSPAMGVVKNILPNNGSASAESKCDTEPSWSAEDEALKNKVVDQLCDMFWPEVQLWLDLSHQHLDLDHLSLRQSDWEVDREVSNCCHGLEGVLTVTPKLLSDRFLERSGSSSLFSSRSSTAQSVLREGSRQLWSCDGQQWQQQSPAVSRCISGPQPWLPPLSSGSNSSSSSKVPMSSQSSRRSDRTSSGSSASKLPPIDPASLQSIYVEGHRINVSERPLYQSGNSCCCRPRANK